MLYPHCSLHNITQTSGFQLAALLHLCLAPEQPGPHVHVAFNTCCPLASPKFKPALLPRKSPIASSNCGSHHTDLPQSRMEKGERYFDQIHSQLSVSTGSVPVDSTTLRSKIFGGKSYIFIKYKFWCSVFLSIATTYRPLILVQKIM